MATLLVEISREWNTGHLVLEPLPWAPTSRPLSLPWREQVGTQQDGTALMDWHGVGRQGRPLHGVILDKSLPSRVKWCRGGPLSKPGMVGQEQWSAPPDAQCPHSLFYLGTLNTKHQGFSLTTRSFKKSSSFSMQIVLANVPFSLLPC